MFHFVCVDSSAPRSVRSFCVPVFSICAGLSSSASLDLSALHSTKCVCVCLCLCEEMRSIMKVDIMWEFKQTVFNK